MNPIRRIKELHSVDRVYVYYLLVCACFVLFLIALAGRCEPVATKGKLTDYKECNDDWGRYELDGKTLLYVRQAFKQPIYLQDEVEIKINPQTNKLVSIRRVVEGVEAEEPCYSPPPQSQVAETHK